MQLHLREKTTTEELGNKLKNPLLKICYAAWKS